MTHTGTNWKNSKVGRGRRRGKGWAGGRGDMEGVSINTEGASIVIWRKRPAALEIPSAGDLWVTKIEGSGGVSVTQPRDFSAVSRPAINEIEQMLYDRLNRDLRVAFAI